MELFYFGLLKANILNIFIILILKELVIYMVKSGFEHLSDLEFKILRELQNNCRKNFDDIGKKCGCSRYKVTRVMKKLEERGIILGYSAIINPKKMNLNYYIILLKRTSIPVEEEFLKKLPVKDITDILPAAPESVILEDTHYLHGCYDWITTFYADDISNAKEYANLMLKVFHKYIDSLELLEIVNSIRIVGHRIKQEKVTIEVSKP